MGVVEYKNWVLSFSSDAFNDNHENENIKPSVIELDLFDGYKLTISYPTSKIIISDETNIADDFDWTRMLTPFNLNNESLVIYVSNDIKNYKLVLDKDIKSQKKQ